MHSSYVDEWDVMITYCDFKVIMEEVMMTFIRDESLK
jgi:hypothetical protein